MGYIKFPSSLTSQGQTFNCSDVYSVSISSDKFHCKYSISAAAGKVVSAIIGFTSANTAAEAARLEKAILKANQNPASCDLFETDTEGSTLSGDILILSNQDS